MEVHDNPAKALSDSNTVLNIKYLELILSQAKAIHELKQNLIKTYGEDNVHVQ